MEASRRTKSWRATWMVTSMVAIAVVVILLVWPFLLAGPAVPRQAAPSSSAAPRGEAVRVTDDGAIIIAEDSPLHDHLTHVKLESKLISYPALTVSGSILARIRKGTESIEDRWQFSTSELATKYADWLRIAGEVEFARSQLKKTEELTKAQTDYLQATVARLEPLTKSGSVPDTHLKAAQSDLIKAQLQGEKDVFTAQSTLRVAMKTKTALERDLSQNGIEPVVFDRAVEHMVLIAANVPETKVSLVREGQGCLARFYAYPERTFDAHVETLSSLLTADRRTMRVVFELSDPSDILRPGMFAEVGLGTDDREALLLPADALLHINLADYVVVADGPGKWRVTSVRVGEEHDNAFEVLQGLSPGAVVIGQGAILLKPAAMQALHLAGGEEQ